MSQNTQRALTDHDKQSLITTNTLCYYWLFQQVEIIIASWLFANEQHSLLKFIILLFSLHQMHQPGMWKMHQQPYFWGVDTINFILIPWVIFTYFGWLTSTQSLFRFVWSHVGWSQTHVPSVMTDSHSCHASIVLSNLWGRTAKTFMESANGPCSASTCLA